MSACIDYSYQLIEVIWDHNLIFTEPNFSFYRIKPPSMLYSTEF